MDVIMYDNVVDIQLQSMAYLTVTILYRYHCFKADLKYFIIGAKMEKITTFYRPLSGSRLNLARLDLQLVECKSLSMLKDLFDEVSDMPFGIIDGAMSNSQYKMLLGRTHVDLMNNSEHLQR